MALPALVLVHGGGLAADSWELTVDEIHRLAPELTVLAVDLPGRRDKPGDLPMLTIADFVESVIDDIEEAGLGDIVLVGHSMAGLTVPGVVAKLGSSRVREMVLATAFVPPEGKSLVDTLTGPWAPTARRNAKKGGLSNRSSRRCADAHPHRYLSLSDGQRAGTAGRDSC
jgi:pimeloyl-ACP methyl ester carboxylesterase